MRIKNKQPGFTIIEVLIVLAIAGLIMLVVFLAVPALQRNSRTTQAKNGASSILGAVGEFISNNNGQMPSACAIAADGTITISSITSGTAQATGKTQSGYVCNASTTFPAANSATGTFTVAYNHKCNGNTGFTANNRSTAVGFVLDNSVQQCVES